MPETNSTTEIWKPVVGYEGTYDVSNLGRVRRILSGHVTISGYKTVGLGNGKKHKTRKVHQLVMEAFHGPVPLGQSVNHMDGNKQNNSLENLQYITHKENVIHAHGLGLCHPQRGEAHHNSSLKESQVVEIRKLIASGVSRAEVARKMSIKPYHVWRVATGRAWKHVVHGSISP